MSHSAEKFRRGTLLCCVSENFWSRKKLWIRGRGKYQDFLLKIFCLTVSKSAVGEPFSLSSISGIKKLWMREWGGGVSSFSVENFLSHSAEKFHTVTLLCCVSEKFWSRKSLWIRGGRKYDGFLSKNFRLTVPKIFVGEPLSVSLVSSIENIYALEGYVTIFRRKHFVSQNRKTLHGNHSVLCFGKFPVTNNFMDEKRVV